MKIEIGKDYILGIKFNKEVGMKTKVYSKLQSIVLFGVILISAIFLSNCRGTPPHPSPQTPSPLQPPEQKIESTADLLISKIQVYPAQPQAGQRFTLNVYVRNDGQAPSGKFDLALSIKDVSRMTTYPVGTFRIEEVLQPGDNITAYASTDRLVNYPGSHQVDVEIKPFLFKDGNNQNNKAIWAFTVN
jgi:hypothetical protein